MDIGFILAVIGFVVGLLITPIAVIFAVKGIRTMGRVRDLMGRPPGDYGQLGTRRGRLPGPDQPRG